MKITRAVESSRFGWLIDPSVERPNTPWNTEIDQTDSFTVLPSLGSIIPGWVLVIPRRPLINLSALTEHEKVELDDLLMRLQERLAAFSGDAFCFEHGADHIGSLTGCGADQAHLHLVPLPFDLLAAARSRCDTRIRWREGDPEASRWSQLPTVGEYIALGQLRDGASLIGTVLHPTSQWIRKLIASALNEGSSWNYRTHLNIPNVRKTIRVLGR